MRNRSLSSTRSKSPTTAASTPAEPETWQLSGDAAEMYERHFVPAIFAAWAPRTAEAAAPAPGDRVLDVACGTGVVARACAERLGRLGAVTGLDLNPGMLAVARRVRPDIDWRQGDVAALPFADGSFDAVTCQFALMFFPDRVGALAEMWRVLAPGGRLAVAVWGPIEAIPAYTTLAELADRHAGRPAGDAVRAPFVLGNPAEVREIFAAADIAEVELETGRETERFPSLAAFVEIEIRGTPAGRHFSDGAYAALLHEAPERLAFCCGDDGRVVFDSPAHIAVARKG